MPVLTSLANQPAHTVTKASQTHSDRQKLTQKQLGAISSQVDTELRARSGGICEVRRLCKGAQAAERAHTRGRRVIGHKTTVNDLLHACKSCHVWLDQTPEGIKFNRYVREHGGTTVYLQHR